MRRASKVAAEAADLVGDIVPAARASRTLAYAIVAAVLVGAIAAAWWWLVARPAGAQADAGQAKVDATFSAAAAEIAGDALDAQVEHGRTITRIDTITRRGENAVRTAPGAQARAPGVAAALRDAVCLHELTYAAEPGCAAVRRNRGIVAATDADAGGDAPDR